MFLLNNADVIINNEEIKVSLSEDEKATIRRDMTRLEKSIKEMSNNQINISYEIIEIDKPLTTLSYDDVNGYYISEADAYKLLVSEVLKKILITFLYAQTYLWKVNLQEMIQYQNG